MKAPRRDLARIIAKQAQARRGSSKWLRVLAAYLLQTNRTNELAPILRDVRREWAAQGLLDITAVSAHPLSPSVRRDIARRAKQLYPKAKRLVITPELDPNLIGGVRLDIGDYEIDTTVRTRLERFRSAAMRGSE